MVPIIPVGPGDHEAARAVRVVDSLARHEPDVPGVVLLIDGIAEADLRPRLRPGPLMIDYVVNPRRGRGSGTYDGLACGLTAAFRHVADRHPDAHAWKIDTDALVLRRTSGQIADYFAARPRAGMIGTYETNPGGVSREREFYFGAEIARKFLKPVWYWRAFGFVSSPHVGRRNRRFARWMREAHAAGLPWGWHVQGGSYAINGRLLAAWLRSGRLDDPDIWLGAMMSEDVAFSHWTMIDGFTLEDFNAPGEAFGVKAVGLPMPPETLASANYGVVHSLKTSDWSTECALADALTNPVSDTSATTDLEKTRLT